MSSAVRVSRLHARRDDALHARIVSSFELRFPEGGFVRSGSALLRVGARLLAVQDDAYAAAWIDPEHRRVQPLLLRGRGQRLRKKKKPDFEAAVATTGGGLYLLGSGSKDNRRTIVRIPLHGRSRASVKAAPAFYRSLSDALGTRPNIEGAVIQRGRLRLFHRDTGGSANAILDLPASALEGKTAAVKAVIWCKLGSLSGIPLGFTDATAAGQSLIYLAAAEDSRDAVADGPVAGSVLGVINGNTARWTRIEESDGSWSRRKMEGMVLDRDRRTAYLLTDPDDPGKPAELCRLVFTGFNAA